MYISLLGKTPNGDTSLTVFFFSWYFLLKAGCIKTFSDAFCLYGAVFLVALLESSVLFENFQIIFTYFFIKEVEGSYNSTWNRFFLLFLIWRRWGLKSESLQDLSAGSRMMCKAVPSLFLDLEGSWGYS